MESPFAFCAHNKLIALVIKAMTTQVTPWHGGHTKTKPAEDKTCGLLCEIWAVSVLSRFVIFRVRFDSF
jgi:hypothetical protein